MTPALRSLACCGAALDGCYRHHNRHCRRGMPDYSRAIRRLNPHLAGTAIAALEDIGLPRALRIAETLAQTLMAESNVDEDRAPLLRRLTASRWFESPPPANQSARARHLCPLRRKRRQSAPFEPKTELETPGIGAFGGAEEELSLPTDWRFGMGWRFGSGEPKGALLGPHSVGRSILRMSRCAVKSAG